MGLSNGILSITALPTTDVAATVTATDAFGDTGTSSVTIKA